MDCKIEFKGTRYSYLQGRYYKHFMCEMTYKMLYCFWGKALRFPWGLPIMVARSCVFKAWISIGTSGNLSSSINHDITWSVKSATYLTKHDLHSSTDFRLLTRSGVYVWLQTEAFGTQMTDPGRRTLTSATLLATCSCATVRPLTSAIVWAVSFSPTCMEPNDDDNGHFEKVWNMGTSTCRAS